MSLFTDILAQWLPAAVVGVAAVAVGFKRLHVGWAKDDTQVALQRAHKEIIETMRAELQRMSEQNTKLGGSVNALQLRIIELTAQVGRLTIENNSLTQEIGELRSEIANLTAGGSTISGGL